MKALLFIIATPIGNLGDISMRAIDTLRSVDCILCEDTRVTAILLAHFGISQPLLSYHAHSNERRTQEIIAMLKDGKQLALVSDAGTPGINDPGGKLVERTVAALGNLISIVPIPGPSAPLAALSISGFPADRFIYLGFPPHKKGRETFFRELAGIEETAVFLESTHRILKTLASLGKTIPNRQIMIARELTKIYETVYRGTPAEVTSQIEHDTIKGEFVVVVRRKR